MKRSARKPFVVPQIKEQASLAKVTLISGGKGHGHDPKGPKGPHGPHS